MLSGDVLDVYGEMLNFRQGGLWDLQRVGPSLEFDPKFVDFSTVAIGLYGAAAGISEEDMLSAENAYAALRSSWSPDVPMDSIYTHLPEVNVYNTKLGYSLYNSGRIGY